MIVSLGFGWLPGRVGHPVVLRSAPTRQATTAVQTQGSVRHRKGCIGSKNKISTVNEIIYEKQKKKSPHLQCYLR